MNGLENCNHLISSKKVIMKKATGNIFNKPRVDQPYAKFCNKDFREIPTDMDFLKHKLTQNLVKQIEHRIEYIHYFESIATGKRYEGFYDYVPAKDPLCIEVFEARIDLFNKNEQIIENLKKKVEELEKINSNLTRII